jgi:hypothetical protein
VTGFFAGDFLGVIGALEGVLMIVLTGLFLGVEGVLGGLGLVGVEAALVDFFGLLGVRGEAVKDPPPLRGVATFFASKNSAKFSPGYIREVPR